jgi:hypothetical protein
MKKLIIILLTFQIILTLSQKVSCQSNTSMQEFGISAGGFTNFPANKNYLKEDMNVFYVAPYLRTGKHEFSAGMVYPLKFHGIYFPDNDLNPQPGAVAGYKFYVFDIDSRENLFIHYSFQYLRFKGNYDVYSGDSAQHWTETDNYINNVIGLGYNLFFDADARFGFYYILDYVISQAGYKRSGQVNDNAWTTTYIWNNISTHFGFSFKLTSIKKKDKK